MIGRLHPAMKDIPRDVWWPRRLVVPNDGESVPFELMLYWHWQFWLLPAEANV